jgi:hypothetical protein
MSTDESAGLQEKFEARLLRRWPRLEMIDLADLAMGQASLLECLQRRYQRSRDELEAEITEFENATPPPGFA